MNLKILIVVVAIIINVVLIKYDISLFPDFVNKYWGIIMKENAFIFQIATVSGLVLLIISGIEMLKKTYHN